MNLLKPKKIVSCQRLLLYNPTAATHSLGTNHTYRNSALNIIMILNEWVFIWITTKTYEKDKGLILSEATQHRQLKINVLILKNKIK